MSSYDIEALLSAALNGQPLPKSSTATIRKNFAPPSHHRHSVTYRYSVQESWGGPRFVVTYKENTIMHEEVKRKAIEDMNRKGYINITLLDKITT